MKPSLLDEEEYVEELEPLEAAKEGAPKKKSPRDRDRLKPIKIKRSKNATSEGATAPVAAAAAAAAPDATPDSTAPDYRWDEGSTPEKDKSLSRRTKIRRSLSLDMNTDREAIFRRRQEKKDADSTTKRHSWDSPRRPTRSRSASPESQDQKPDFRWDNPDFRWDQVEIDPERKENVKSRRKPPRRTKSDLTAYDRPGSGRGRVKFCLDNNICFEVPRATKDMKPDLFYTKKEIKEFKAERREEKQRLSLEKLEAQMAQARDHSFALKAGAPIATSC